jgi:hypothetical protein
MSEQAVEERRGWGFRHHVGRAVLDPGPPGHASVDIVPA